MTKQNQILSYIKEWVKKQNINNTELDVCEIVYNLYNLELIEFELLQLEGDSDLLAMYYSDKLKKRVIFDELFSSQYHDLNDKNINRLADEILKTNDDLAAFERKIKPSKGL